VRGGKRAQEGDGERSDVGTTNAHPPQLKHPRALDIVGNYGFVGFVDFFRRRQRRTTCSDLEMNSVSTSWQRVGSGIEGREESRRMKRDEAARTYVGRLVSRTHGWWMSGIKLENKQSRPLRSIKVS
jgi:hypothetical protein